MPPRRKPPLPTATHAAYDAFVAAFGRILAEGRLPAHARAVRRLTMDTIYDMPNLLLHGPLGFPKDLLVREALRQRFGLAELPKSVDRTWDNGVPYKDHPAFVWLDLSHPDMPKDMHAVVEVLDGIIRHACMHTGRHIVFIDHVDRVSQQTQAFRVLFERFAHHAVFVCTTSRVCALEPAIQSRFTAVRVPLPTLAEIRAVMAAIGRPLPLPDAAFEELGHRNLVHWLALADWPEGSVDPEAMSYHVPALCKLLEDPRPTREAIRAFASMVVQQHAGVAELARDLLLHVCEEDRSAFLRTACRIDHAVAQTSRGREILHVELLLHEAIYGDLRHAQEDA